MPPNDQIARARAFGASPLSHDHDVERCGSDRFCRYSLLEFTRVEIAVKLERAAEFIGDDHSHPARWLRAEAARVRDGRDDAT